jgi:predicted ATPase/DNA-binding winged helix-turn-helix (wHTH) protein/tetratricopeptide (TPR) repeat protein
VPSLDLGSLTIDLETRRATRGGVEVGLTAQEVALLRYLAERADQTVPRDELFVRVLGYSASTAASSRALDATVRRLRKKLELDPERPAHLQTDHGRGFRLEGLRAVGGPARIAPAQDRSFGHEAPLAALRDALARGGVITLVGPGGAGKSRLARTVASEPGWAWVAVPAGSDPDGVASAIAAALGLPASVRGVAALLQALRERPAGVVLDAAEVALEAVATLAGRGARAAPDLRWLVTSRAPLGIVAERRIAVEPLALEPAVLLLLDRARERLGGRDWVAPQDPALRELVERLDRLPLAIELAAARAPVLGPEELCQRLHEPSLLRDDRRDADPRHTSLERMIEASWSLLGEQERGALVALGVFHGPFPAEIGARVAGSIELLEALVSQNMIRPRSSDGRLAVYDTIRTFAAHRAEGTGGRLRADRRYAEGATHPGLTPRDRLEAARLALRFGLPIAREAGWLVLRPSASPDPPIGTGERLAFAAELVAAWPHAARIAVAAADVAVLSSDQAQVRAWLEHLDASLRHAQGPERVRVALSAGALEAAAGRPADAAARVLPLADEPPPEGLYAAIVAAGCVARQGDWARAEALLEPVVRRPICRAEARSFDLPSGVALKARAEMLLGTVRMNQGRLDEAERLFKRAWGRWQSEGDTRGMAMVMGNLGGLAHRRGWLAQAARCYQLAIESARAIGELRVCASCTSNLSLIAVELGDPDAIDRLQDAVAAHDDLESVHDLLIAQANLHGVLPALDRRAAAEALEQVAGRALALGLDDVASLALNYRARQLARLDPAEACRSVEEALRLARGQSRLEVLATRASLLAELEPSRATTDLEALYELDDGSIVGVFRLDLELWLAEIERMLATDRARGRMTRIDALLDELGLPQHAPLAARARELRSRLRSE